MDFMHITAEAGNLKVKARRLNESMYELHRPEGLPTMQVLFFHGFQQKYKNAHLFTWTSGDESCLWPQMWLVEKFPDAHILAVSYSADDKLHELLKRADMFIVVENLIADLRHAKIGQEPRCPVVLVGHSYGGLVVKKLCVEVYHELGPESRTLEEPKTVQLLNFVDNVRGVFFYATPHRGIEEKSIKLLDQELLIPRGPLLELVKSLSNTTARLNSDFDRTAQLNEWQIAGLGEDLPSKWGWFGGGLIVPEGSSRYSNFNKAEGTDHISISRPKSKITRSFTALESFVKGIGDEQLSIFPGNRQDVPESVLGIKPVLDKVKLKLKKTIKLGFVGMGGLGKTTLAMALFNDLERGYQYTCFIRDVKDLPGSRHTRVKDAMLQSLHYGGKQSKNKDTGLGFLKGKRLLLVLDDVSSETDLKIVSTLCHDVHVHGDSRFIATSRDPAPLESSSHEVYGVELLSSENSRKLFLNCAFPKVDGVVDVISPNISEDLVDGVVEKCGKLPLALEVIGKYLRRKKEYIWKEAFHALEEAKSGVGYEKILATLQISYDGLESKELKDMFLDASTVFYNEDLSIAMAAWSVTIEGRQKRSWDRLVELSLVWEVSERGKVKVSMHEQLLNLGKMIASTPLQNRNSHRIWNDSEKALRLLSANNNMMDGLKDIIALKFSNKELKRLNCNSTHGMTSTPQDRFSISGRKLQEMTNLQYLWLEGIDIDQTDGSLGACLLAEDVQLPSTLVHLHLSEVNFSGFTFNVHDVNRMTYLKIVGCSGLRKLPKTFEMLQKLERMELQNSSLQSIPDLGKLTSLKTLSLSWVPTAKFPSLPACLEGLMMDVNFPGPYALKTRNGRFMHESQRGVPYFCPGLEKPLQEIEEKLKNTKALGIVGMGGVGKTVIARKLFDHISLEYEYTCFVDNVKGIPSSQLANELFDKFHCKGVAVKRNQMDWSVLKGKKILLMMDDVDSEEQLNCLPTSLDAFGDGSRLIITSRDRGVMMHPKVYADSDIYDVDLLGKDDAKKLFCFHAFRSLNIPDNLVENVERILGKCQGLPLTLEVLGHYLRGADSDPDKWNTTIDRLGKAQALVGRSDVDRVWNSIRFSYDSLSREEQDMFIDAGTTFFGQPLERALATWSTAYENPHLTWRNLERRSLVKEVWKSGRDMFGHDIKFKEIWVHEQLRDAVRKLSKGRACGIHVK